MIGPVNRIATSLLTGLRSSSASSPPSGGENLTDAITQLKKLSTENPIERIKEQVLKSHHMTEAQYDALPPQQRDGITKEIIADVKRQMTGNMSSPIIPKGSAVDLQG